MSKSFESESKSRSSAATHESPDDSNSESSSTSKVAFVTGASNGGIGFHLCQSLLRRGFIVYATARSLEAMSELTHPTNIRKNILEVTNDHQIEETLKDLFENEGRLDLVINNAGTYSTGPLIHNTPDHFKTVLDVNVVSMLRICRAVVPYMAKCRQGTIVNVGSIAGYIPTPWAGIYESSKAAVRVLTEVLEMECRPFNISIILLEPGSVESNLCNNFTNYTPPSNSIYSSSSPIPSFSSFSSSSSSAPNINFDFVKSIQNRVKASRRNCMSGHKFAESVIPKILQPHPPKYIFDGNKWFLFTFLMCLPRRWALALIYYVMIVLGRG